MKSKMFVFVTVFVILSILLSGCAQKPEIKKPEIVVDDISVERVTTQSLDLNVRVIVNNPNPVGANLKKIVFDMYYLENGRSKYLGYGEKYGVEIRKQGETTITIPVTVDSSQAIKAVIRIAKEGAVTIKVSGSAYLDLKVTTFEIPFEKSKEIASEVFRAISPTETPKPSPAQTPTPISTTTPKLTETTPKPTPKQSLQILISPKPAKVDDTVTIKVVDANGNPVSDVRVVYIKSIEAIIEGNVITNGRYIGKTNEQGIVEYKFLQPEIYVIGAERIGYYPAIEYLAVKPRVR